MIPALKNAEFIRYGVMHRNTFINSPKYLDKTLRMKNYKNIYFAGQIAGGEGYVAAIGTGCYAGINIANALLGKDAFILDNRSSLGAIVNYITEENKNFQPMGPNFGIIKSLDKKIKDKKEKYKEVAKIALGYLDDVIGAK